MRHGSCLLSRTLIGVLAMVAGCKAIGAPGNSGYKGPLIIDSLPVDGKTDGIVSTFGGGLTGTVTAPQAAIIANNSAALIDIGGAAFLRSPFRIQSINQAPVPDALVSLVDSAGQSLGLPPVKTDANGRFTFSTLPASGSTFFVRASFNAEGKDFIFENLAQTSAAGTGSVNVDAASTLVAQKVWATSAQHKLSAATLQKLQALIEQLLAVLDTGTIPYMAKGSRDTLAAFDQLLLDMPQVQQAARAVADDLERPAEVWQVSKLADSDSLVAAGVYPDDSRLISANGSFEVDRNGNLYLPRLGTASVPVSTQGLRVTTAINRIATAGVGTASVRSETGSSTADQSAGGLATASAQVIQIIRMTPDGSTSVYAELPPGIALPVLMAFAPDGTLYVVGTHAKTSEVREFIESRTSLLMNEHEGYVFKLTELPQPTVPGRIAVDGNGDLYIALRYYHVVGRMPKLGASPDLVAGMSGKIGYQDGSASATRFSYPASLTLGNDGAIYIADFSNNCVRRLTPSGKTTTVAGTPGRQDYRNGRGGYALLGTPEAITADQVGNIFIADSYSKRVRRLSPEGSIYLVAGSGQDGVKDGEGPVAQFHNPEYLTTDGNGNLYVLDRLPKEPGKPVTEVIRKITKR
ncbi:MAG: hypothetical protein HY692_00095 [Cyanobacteria bacterium NC_groundwater_1444_Ag_S-0.65um_54_12]|nr:hypothetical protein [Cyanobacteria bacterium NC_groundwater_1444_Ag_S-0.65um_54_12]